MLACNILDCCVIFQECVPLDVFTVREAREKYPWRHKYWSKNNATFKNMQNFLTIMFLKILEYMLLHKRMTLLKY